MNRINRLFEEKKGAILSVYFTAGFPKLADTLPIIEALSKGGVDMIEVGVPFSDPLADGPVIQASSQQALQNGMTVKKLFEQLANARDVTDVPLILMGYVNPILAYGIDAFCRDAAAVGIDGLIIPDLPLSEYLKDFKASVERHGLRNVLLITPETEEERVRLIDDNSNSFIYMVSSASTTGTQQSFNEQKEAYFRRVQDMKLKNPTLVGFGISNVETYQSACRFSRGGIIGSAFIKALQSEASAPQAVEKLLKSIGKKG